MQWRKARPGKTAVTIPREWISLHYYEGLSTLFRVENALRIFVYLVLKETFYEKWSSVELPSEGRSIEALTRLTPQTDEACTEGPDRA